MEVKIICSNTLRAAKIAIDNKLKALDPTNLDIQNYVIVPDRSTIDAENALVDACGGSFNTQVVTFKRLVNKYVKSDLNYLNKQNGILLLSQLLENKQKEFLCFINSGNSAGFAAKLYEAICAFKYAKITPEKLSIADLPKHLQAKLSDIKEIYSDYLLKTQDKYFDSADSMNMLEDALSAVDLSKCRFFVYDFLNFTTQEKSILTLIAKNAKELTVAVAYSDFPTHKALFDNAAYNDIVELCKISGTKFTTERFWEYAGPLSRHIFSNVFCIGKSTSQKASKNSLIINSRTSIDKEALALAQFVDWYVKTGGKYKDIKVVCSNTADYSYAIDKHFCELDIPYYLDQKQSLDKTVLSHFILSFLTCFKTNFKLDTVLNFAKNPLFSQNIFAFESFCKKYNVSYDFSEFKYGKDDLLFDEAEKVRQQIQKIAELNLPKTCTAGGYAQLLLQFMQEQNLQNKITELCDYLGAIGQTAEKSRLSQVQKKVLKVLEQATIILGEQPISLDRYIKALNAALASQTVSVVPDKSDCVSVSNLDKGKNHDVKVVCVVGANEGVLPSVKKSCLLFSDGDLNDLHKAGISIEPSLEAENRREKFSLFNLLCEPTQILYVSFLSKQSDVGACSPFVNALKKIFCTEKGDEWKINDFSYPYFNRKKLQDLAVLAAAQKKEGLPIEEGLKKFAYDMYAEQAKQFVLFEANIPDIQNGDKLFFKNDVASITMIENYFKCPFSMFFSNGLQLQQPIKSEFQANDYGTILHAVFEKFIDRFINGKSTEDDDAIKIFDSVMTDEKYAASSKGLKGSVFCQRLKNEAVKTCQALKSQILNSSFRPIHTEYNFEVEKNTAIKLQVGDKTLYLKGKIDRIDKYVCDDGQPNSNLIDTAIVMDYKTGKSEFNEQELYYGIKLQLFIYAMAVKEALKLTPVGCFYVRVADDYDSKEAKTFVGRVVADTKVLSAIENDYEQLKKSNLFFAPLTKDGEINKRSKTCISKQGFDACEDYAIAILKTANKLMQKGYIEINPIKGVCDICQAKGICGIGDTRLLSERKTTTVTADDIVNCIAKKEEQV